MNYTEIEIDGMKELLKENELEIGRLRKEIKNLKEKVEKLEEGLDRKEEINKKLRSDLLMYQNQYGCLTD